MMNIYCQHCNRLMMNKRNVTFCDKLSFCSTSCFLKYDLKLEQLQDLIILLSKKVYKAKLKNKEEYIELNKQLKMMYKQMDTMKMDKNPDFNKELLLIDKIYNAETRLGKRKNKDKAND